MTTVKSSTAAYARTNMQVAAEAFRHLAEYLESLDDAGWKARTGCERWDMRTLADHALGEAVWFPNLARNAVTGEALHSPSIYDDMKAWDRDRVLHRLREAAAEFDSALDGASEESLDTEVDLGFSSMPLWHATYIGMFEAVFHGWDARAIREPEATIPVGWAQHVASDITLMAPYIAHRREAAGLSGTYVLDVHNDVGPMTVTIRNGEVTTERGAAGTPDVTLRLKAEQYIRFMTGRLKLDSSYERDRVEIDGSAERAGELNRVFGGVANEQ